jgi:hypothetical protein
MTGGQARVWALMQENWYSKADLRTVAGPSAYPDIIPGAEEYLAWLDSLPVVEMAWHTCPACGSHMGTNADGVESCPDRTCPYHVPTRGAP